jgi:hypothetical protein
MKGEARLESIIGEDEGRNKWYTLAFGALFMYVRVLQSALKLLRSVGHVVVRTKKNYTYRDRSRIKLHECLSISHYAMIRKTQPPFQQCL